MAQQWTAALISVLLVSLVSLIGVVLLPLSKARVQGLLSFLISLAVGALFGDAFIHLLPTAYADGRGPMRASIYVFTGIYVFFVLEKLISWKQGQDESAIKPVGYINLTADTLHNFVDGLLIGASYLVNPHIGIATTIAVFLHEVPKELGGVGVLIYSGFSKNQAIFLNFLSGLAAVLGTLISLIIGGRHGAFVSAMLPLTAGGFIYIAGSDLLPELRKETGMAKSLQQLVAVLLGIGLMFAIRD